MKLLIVFIMLNFYSVIYAQSKTNSSNEDLGSTVNDIQDKTNSTKENLPKVKKISETDSQVIEVKPESQKGEVNSQNEDLGITVNKIQNDTIGI